MLQTSFRTDSRKAGERIIVPLGVVRLIRTGFRRYGLDRLFDGFKESGVPMSLVMENLCIGCLESRYSMNDWDGYVNNMGLRREFFCKGHEIRRWTLQRDLSRAGIYLEEVVDHLTKVTRIVCPDTPTHAYIDGSHVKRNGAKGDGVAYGEGGGTIQLQNQFMTAIMVDGGIPISIEAYPGNQNDPQQYGDFIPQILFHLKRGSLLVMDNGGAAAKILDMITDEGSEYLTRVRINRSDLKNIESLKDSMIYVGMNAACIMHTFASSGRTTYLYFSSDSFAASIARAERALAEKERKRKEAQKILEEGDALKLVT